MSRAHRILPLLLVLGGCARPGTLRTSGPFDIARAPSEGLRYFLTRDLLTVDAKVSHFHDVVRERGVCVTHDSLSTSWTLTVTTVPDRRQAYRLGLRPSATLDQTLGVKVSETGVLTSLNYAGTDQRAAIATTIAKGAFGVLGAFVPRVVAHDTLCAAPSKAKAVPLSTKHVIRTFDLTELPAAPDAGASWTTIAKQSAAYARDGELYSLANIYLTVSPLPEPAGALDPAPNASGSAIGCTGADSVCARIYFREPITRMIRVHVSDAESRGGLTVAEERIVPVVSAADPILHIAFGTEVLGAGKIALTFGPHGNVMGVEQTSSAALGNAASAVTSAGAAARDAYDAALKARVEELDLEIKAAKDNATLRNMSDTSTSTP
ncbi:MAG: hypothetical protein M3Y05_12095 [Gemmatimonadota bacterium]|nr:hypothetical protein [Gemmatimonadota bacterium]